MPELGPDRPDSLPFIAYLQDYKKLNCDYMPDHLPSKLPTWVRERVLHFLNEAGDARSLLSQLPENKSEAEGRSPEYFLGHKVAERILEMRENLPGRRYSNLKQLRDVRGLGADKFKTILQSFNLPSALLFVNSLYEKKILSKNNWTLQPHTLFFEEREEYQEHAHDPCRLKAKVQDLLATLAQKHECSAAESRLVHHLIENAFPDAYTNSTDEAALALALWFYQFDADNWFSQERIREECQTYFSLYRGSHPWRMDLYLLKPFDHSLLLQGLAPKALPVVCTEAELSITIWLSGLRD